MPLTGSILHSKLIFSDGLTFGNTVSPIPASGNLEITMGNFQEITTGNLLYIQTYISAGNIAGVTFTPSDNGFSYSHGSTKLIQSNSNFY